ncbi:hypothetical protein ACMFMG_010657 [Clarireedia jacksonii]
MPSNPRIAIVGGGPSGLALSLLLRQRNIPSTIYELRPKPTAEELAKPSGMLDLHEESGLKVMREAGLWDDFQKAIGDCSQACRIYTPEGKLVHEDDGGVVNRPEIPRNALARILLEKVDMHCVKWSHKIRAVTERRNERTGAVEVEIDAGSNGIQSYDFVVGADGAWSRVRRLLSDVEPSYANRLYVQATVRNVSTKYPHLLELNGTGTLWALGHGNGILTHRGPQDSIRVYTCVSTTEEHWAKSVGMEGKSAAEVKEVLLNDEEIFAKWDQRLKDLLTITFDEETKDNPDKSADILPLYELPVGYTWEHRTGVTLVGDAAHLTLPAGEGVNMGLLDSLELAQILGEVTEVEDAAAWQAAVDPLVLAFEEKMQMRAKIEAEGAIQINNMLWAENGAQESADMMKSFQSNPDAEGQ